jgi:glutamate dehydrogenase/leucine dehydrogenase
MVMEALAPKPSFTEGSLPPLDAAQLVDTFPQEIGDLQESGFEIAQSFDLLPHLGKEFPRAGETVNQLESIALVELNSTAADADPLLHDRLAVLMKTKEGNSALIAVALYDETDLGWHFGGAGNYPVLENASRLGQSMHHSEKLAEAMRHKAWEIGVADHLAGSKTIITTDAWHQDETIQIVTGMMFSPKGVWPNVITGSDVGQNATTIANMELGSSLGDGVGQIVGTEHGLPDTASYARHSMEQTYKSMREHFDILPLNQTTAIVEGLGKIGTTTAKMLVDNEVQQLIVTDPSLFPDLAESLNINQDAATTVIENYQDLLSRAQAKGVEVKLIRPEQLEHPENQANLYCPCSSNERIITQSRVDNLAKNGVKVILSGANNAFADESLPDYAQETYGILTPPPGLANGGSATSAAFEPTFLIQHSQGEWENSQQFISQVLVPHITTNSQEKMAIFAGIMADQQVSLYRAGDVAFQQWKQASQDTD